MIASRPRFCIHPGVNRRFVAVANNEVGTAGAEAESITEDIVPDARAWATVEKSVEAPAVVCSTGRGKVGWDSQRLLGTVLEEILGLPRQGCSVGFEKIDSSATGRRS